MSTYEEMLKVLGSSETTTNAGFKAALDMQDAVYKQMARNNSYAEFWQRILIILAITAVYFLWRISQQTKKVSSTDHPISPTQSAAIGAKNLPVVLKHPTTKPPLPDSPDQTSPTRSRTIAPTAPGVASNVHPDSRFFPKG